MIFWRIISYYNILSLDVALGAVISTVFFSQYLEVPIPWSSVVALAIAIWSIYTIDHIKDANRIKEKASLPRHQFHQRHKGTLMFLVFAALIGILPVLFWVPIPTLWGGVALTFVCIIYLLINRYSDYVLPKEVWVALVYTMGILMAPVSLLDFRTLHATDWLLFGQYFLLALINLLSLSLIEVQSDSADGQGSFATVFGSRITERIVKFLLIAVGVCSVTGLFISQMDPHVIHGQLLVGMMWLVLAALVFNFRRFNRGSSYRLLADGIFIIPILYPLLT